MPAIALGIFGLFLSMLMAIISMTSSAERFHDDEQRTMNVRAVASAVLQNTIETGAFPASIGSLATQPGYQYLRLKANLPWQGYAVSGILNDGTWEYQRAVVYSQRPQMATTPSVYLSGQENACGSAAFTTAGPWCGNKNSFWWIWDTRTDYASQIAAERAAQRRLLQKFARAYELVQQNRQAFPNPGTSGIALVKLIPGYNQTATTCTGSWLWQNVPLDCADLYSVWGTPRVYNYLSEDFIALLATSPILDNAGAPVQVATQLDATVRVWNN